MDKDTLINHLNQDLADEFAAIIQYTVYSAKVYGPYRPQLSAFFQQEVADEQAHALFLANKIAALGGTPITTPHEVKAAKTNKEMVAAVLEAEKKAVANYTQRALEAEEMGEKGLAVQLEDMVAEESTHAEETARILQDWPL
ncbi:MAG: ferritin-like domain-containing protein [Kiritimatiellia bacterium]